VPTDSGIFRSQFCGREIVNAVLIVGGVAFERAAHTASHSARTAPERHAPASARATNDREARSPLRAYWSVYELPSERRALGGPRGREALERNAPNLLAVICGNLQRYSKPLKQRGFLPRSGGHSSRYWCQRDSVFARIIEGFNPSKATWAASLCETPSLRRGRRPDHVRKERIGT
jgi:hypothetical protein